MNGIESFHGLVWHLECMDLSAEAIENFRPPADPFQMRMHYSLYLTNLMSVIDMAREWCGEPFDKALLENLSIPEFSGEAIVGYLRELRNGVVHRGIDPTAGGTEANGIVWAVAPTEVKNRKGDKIFLAPTLLLRDLFTHCELRVKPIVERFIQPLAKKFGNTTPEAMLASICDTMEMFPHVPDWAKKMARKHITPEILDAAQIHQAGKLNELLKPRPQQNVG
ncbi:hypothetical protein [Sphingobium sp.]|uniref:hypothetical protein n=1 Tax=Sphingobium sp. TaxID=1912891 RepID=UPI0035C777C2